MSNFVAIDVETANENLWSICQLGVAKFENGACSSSRSWLINPETHFSGINVSIHGIEPSNVANAPTLAQLISEIRAELHGKVVVSHTHFDRVAFSRAAEHYSFDPIICDWLDTAKVARRTWQDVARSGYGLKALAKRFGIKFDHHDAGEDARACGEIMSLAISESGHSPDVWLAEAMRPITEPPDLRRDGHPDGPLSGEVCAFTGALNVTRSEAADLVSKAGAAVGPGVTKKTTLLIVGDQDIDKLAGHSKSSKHRKAEELIGKGQDLRIVGETDFRRLVEG